MIETLDSALESSRAMILLDVPWSCYTMRARGVFHEARPHLEELGITFLVVDEEAPQVRQWLNDLEIEYLTGAVARGAGSVLWLEAGEVVKCSHDGGSLTLYQLLKRTRELWAKK